MKQKLFKYSPILFTLIGFSLFFTINDSFFNDSNKLSIIIKALVIGLVIGTGWIVGLLYERQYEDSTLNEIHDPIIDLILILVGTFTFIKIAFL